MTMTLVSTVTVGSGGAASIDFTGIDGTATDLMVLISVREATTSNWTAYIRFNNDTASNYSNRRLQGNGSSVISATYSPGNLMDIIGNSSSATANTFGNASLYIPNYSGSTYKSVSIDSVSENNDSLSYQRLQASTWNSTSAITSIKIFPDSGNWAEYSTVSLYTITKGSGGATVS